MSLGTAVPGKHVCFTYSRRLPAELDALRIKLSPTYVLTGVSTERTSTTRSVVTQPLHPGQSYPTGSPVRVCNTVSTPSALLELGIYSSVIVIFY
jgi:hypothetical protein